MDEAGQYDVTIEQSSGFTLPLRYEAPEGSPVNFTGSTARLQCRSKLGSSAVLFELNTTNGSIVLGSDGSIVLSKSALQTAALTFSSGVYDLEITPPAGEPCKLIRGNVYASLVDANRTTGRGPLSVPPAHAFFSGGFAIIRPAARTRRSWRQRLRIGRGRR